MDYLPMKYFRSLSSYFFSKKRTAAESSNDEHKNEGSDTLFRQENNAKRAKLASFNDTTLQDLPTELIELILVKVVTMEVKSMKLAKSVWKEKAELVISRLRTVCSHWSSILETNFFRNELHRTLNGIAQETIRLEVLHLSQIPFYAYKVTTMKDDMFTLGSGERIIVYNRNDLTKVKYVIALPGTSPLDISACNVSNCVYVLVDTKPTKEAYHYSILRITENKAHRFNSLPWIRALHLQDFACISVSDNGSLIVRSWPFMVCTYDAKGRLKSKVKSSPSSPRISCWYNPIYKSNGNFVLACYSDEELTEFDDRIKGIRRH